MTVPSIGSVVQSWMNSLIRSTPKIENNQPDIEMEDSHSILSDQEIELLIDAVWRRQRCFVAGDRRFREYGAILEKLRDMIPYNYVIDEFK
jgi:hypothetical protein